MDWLECKACGSSAIMPMDVSVDSDELDELDIDGFEMERDQDDDAPAPDREVEPYDETKFEENDDQESRFFTCHVCGDNWLSVREQADEGQWQVTFIHQMGMAPVLKRVAHMETHIVMNESTVKFWEYYLDEDNVDEDAWLKKLGERRKVLKSVCSN